MNTQTQKSRFPVGGDRQPVRDYLTKHGFVVSAHSDKFWTRADGVTLSLYGSGSMASIRRADKSPVADTQLEDAVTALEAQP